MFCSNNNDLSSVPNSGWKNLSPFAVINKFLTLLTACSSVEYVDTKTAPASSGAAGKVFKYSIVLTVDTVVGDFVVGTATTITITNTDNITGANGVDGSADSALGVIAKSLGNVAAGMAALKGYQAVSNVTAANLKAAAARIQDTDYALETANLTKAAILNQSAMAMVAQANQAQQAILSVIQ